MPCFSHPWHAGRYAPAYVPVGSHPSRGRAPTPMGFTPLPMAPLRPSGWVQPVASQLTAILGYSESGFGSTPSSRSALLEGAARHAKIPCACGCAVVVDPDSNRSRRNTHHRAWRRALRSTRTVLGVIEADASVIDPDGSRSRRISRHHASTHRDSYISRLRPASMRAFTIVHALVARRHGRYRGCG